MMNIDTITPPAAVQEDTQSIKYWHKKALEADETRSNSSLDHAEALYYINDGDGFKELGYDSMAEYSFNTFGKSKQWTNKLISIHKKFVIELGKTKQDLKKVTFGKISKLVSIADEDNVDDLLDFAFTASQKEVDNKVKEHKGLEPNETKEDDDTITMRFKMPEEVAPVIREALDMARDEYSDSTGHTDIQDFKALEILSAHYCLSRDLGGDWEESLNNELKKLGDIYQIDVSWEKRDG